MESTNAYSSFIITLRNGRMIRAEQYRIEGKDLLLYFENGVMRISKSEVKSIFEEERQIKKGKEEEIKEKGGVPQKNLKEQIPVQDRNNRKEGIEYYKKRKRELQERLDQSKKVYFDATNKNEKDEARKRMQSASKELFELEKEVIEKNNGAVPKWWQEN